MDSAKTLYSILNILIILILFSIGLGLVLVLLMFLNVIPTDTIASKSNLLAHKNNPGLYVFIILMLTIYGVFVYGLWKLKAAAKHLLQQAFYNLKLIKDITISGKYLVLTGVFAWLIDGLSGIYFKHEFSIQLSDKIFTYLFIIAMGLLMMLIGNVINDAKNIKQENDLTI